MYVCMYVRTFVRTYVFMYVFMYVYMYAACILCMYILYHHVSPIIFIHMLCVRVCIHPFHHVSKFQDYPNQSNRSPPAASKACASSEGLAAKDPRASWRLSRLLPAAMPQVETTHDHTQFHFHTEPLPPLSVTLYLSPSLYISVYANII